MIVAGRLVRSSGVERAQVRFEDARIAEVGANLGQPDYEFDETCLVFAGMGDVHVHAREDVTGRDSHKEDFQTVAGAALNGGVVHVADMPNNPVPPVDDSSYAAKRKLVDEKDLDLHVTLYAGIGPGTRPLEQPVPYKVYMGPSVGELHFRSLSELERALSHYRGCHVSFHCEDPELLEKHRTALTHEQRRPPACEVSAVRFALDMVERYDLQGKLCHLSVADTLPLVREAKRSGLRVTCEVAPHHLFFDVTCLDEHNRKFMQMNPPLRTPEDRQALLEALRDGTVDYLATDHAPHTLDEKQRGVSGQPHLDTFGPFVTWLLVEQGFRPEQVARSCCQNPGDFANAFHSGAPFGRIEPGYSASLTVLNLDRPTTVRRHLLKTKCGWSPFEGVTFPGSVEAVFVGGRRVR